METIFSLYSDALSCQPPTINYALLLLEIYLLLKVKVMKAGKLAKIKTTPDFVKYFKEQNRYNTFYVNCTFTIFS